MKLLLSNPIVNNISILVFFLLVVIGENIVTVLFGLPYQDYLKFFYLISLLLLVIQYEKFLFNRIGMLLLGFLFFSFLYAIISHHKVLYYPKSLVTPLILFYCIPKMRRLWKNIFLMLISIYIVNSLIAIWEKLNHSFLLGWVRVDYLVNDSFRTNFRSVSLLGYSLQDALFTTIVMTFILFSKIKSEYKYALWGLGFIALLCFEGRASIMLNALLLCLYFITLFKGKDTNLKNVALIVVISLSLFYIYNNTDYGNRLKSLGLNDNIGSTEARLNAIQMINYIDGQRLVFGMETSEYEVLRERSEVVIVENFWIAWVCSYGLIIIIPFVLVSTYMAIYFYRGYKARDALLTSIAFVVLASTNNSLEWSYVFLYVFFSCIYIFNPSHISHCIPSFFVEK